MDRRKLSILGVGLAVVLFAALNAWGSLELRGYRLDLTQGRVFTLSDGTRQLLAQMQEPVTLRLYVSRALREANPFLGTYADRVQDMLEAYATASNGRVALELIDPEPFSVDEDRAVGFGLEPVALDSGQSAYFGIAGTNSTDDVDVLPILSPERERFLEYDLTRLVYNLANPEKPALGLISGLPLNGDPLRQYQPWAIYEQLGQLFDIRHLGGDIDAIEPEIRLLLIAHPQGLTPKTLWAIDQFVLGGGKALVFVDPQSEAMAMRQQRPMPGAAATASDLEPLLKAWGVELVPDRIVADPQTARQVQLPVGGRQQVVDYLAWLSVPEWGLNRDEIATAELHTVNLATAGWLKAVEGAGTTLTPLVTSSADAMAADAETVRMFPDPIELIRSYQRGGVPMVMAARLSGPAKSAYPDAPPEGVEAKDGRLVASQGPIDVIVVADSDILDDRSWLATQSLFGQQVGIPVADNADFVANALDFLAGSSALAGLRRRDVTFRPFTRVAEIRRAAEAQYRAKERELTERLQDLQRKLASMEVGESDDGALMTAAQKAELDGFRAQLLDTRRELRDVQHALRSDIEALRDRARFANIAAVPLLIAALAVVVALVRKVRMRRRFDATAS
jgi:ABC-type uncharacterized transport system involved in gliding motility auxiliary subunit